MWARELMSQCRAVLPPGLRGPPSSQATPGQGLLLVVRDHLAWARGPLPWASPASLQDWDSWAQHPLWENTSPLSWALAENWHCLGRVSQLRVLTQPSAPSH